MRCKKYLDYILICKQNVGHVPTVPGYHVSNYQSVFRLALSSAKYCLRQEWRPLSGVLRFTAVRPHTKTWPLVVLWSVVFPFPHHERAKSATHRNLARHSASIESRGSISQDIDLRDFCGSFFLRVCVFRLCRRTLLTPRSLFRISFSFALILVLARLRVWTATRLCPSVLITANYPNISHRPFYTHLVAVAPTHCHPA